jgi:hypothetical protein
VNADLSVAPEIAQLAARALPPRTRATTAPPTAGRAAGELARLAAAPERWWDLVRFDPHGPARIPVPGAEGTWLLVLPPGAAAECDCRYATLLAGEATEAAAPLHCGRVRVHGRANPRQVRGAAHGYSVSLHAIFYPERSVAPARRSLIPPGE